MRGRVNAIRTFKGLVADLRFKTHFQQLLGKFYAPFEQYKDIYSLALEKGEKYQQENKLLLNQLKDYFFVEKFKLEKDQQDVLVRMRTRTH